ncbi:MAG: prevent-host-death family protein [Gemmatimonadetes bacterium]|nr:prevent-host-death family protein [Gemmatimonadota bacterium]
MITTRDIYSLTDFQRHTREHIDRLKQTGRPEVLTVNGRAEVVVQDAEAYQAMLDTLEQAEAIVAIREGLESIERGEGRPALAMLRETRAKYGPDPGK